MVDASLQSQQFPYCSADVKPGDAVTEIADEADAEAISVGEEWARWPAGLASCLATPLPCSIDASTLPGPPCPPLFSRLDRTFDGEGSPSSWRASLRAGMDFTDQEAMKQQIRDSLLKDDKYCVFEFYHTKGIWQNIGRHPYFENATLTAISLNAIWIAIDTDYNPSDVLIDAPVAFFVMENLFCAYFFAEWLVRFMSFRRKCNGLKDSWFVFDSVLLLLMVLETWVLVVVAAISGNSANSSLLGKTEVLRLFRLLRLSRLARMLRSLPELMILIKGMRMAVTSVLYVTSLLGILTYVFAIAFTVLSRGTQFGELYFNNVGFSMYSLVIYAAFLDDLAAFCDNIRAESPELLLLVLAFICLSALTVMNMLIGVLCEVTGAVAANEKEERLCMMVSEMIGSAIQRRDTDSDGSISYDEFNQMLSLPSVLHALELLEVDPVSLVDFADVLFGEGACHRRCTPNRFMEIVLDLRGSNTITVKDLRNFWKQVRNHITCVNSKVAMLSMRVEAIETRAAARITRVERKVGALLGEPVSPSPTETTGSTSTINACD
eukprot:NODE_3509_length_2025_cov_16.994731.p1 GENE.NODE_3509_length_2025_cov_16.994731~~NODE_3509_length_2025_cov_16.994731.p1  ORF type:complete len:550 (+),score=99.90 NODE_3509_length_2025_cov_16.994731:127-1776(+)